MTAQEKIAHRLTLQQCGKSNIERRIIKGGAEALHSRVATLRAFPRATGEDEGGFDPLHFAAYEQLWLTYNALQRTAASHHCSN